MKDKFRKGMNIYSHDDKMFGSVDDFTDTEVHTNGRRIPMNSFTRVENDRAYLGSNFDMTAYQSDAAVIRVPVAEERLSVSKNEAELGEVQIHKTVTSEQQSIPVELRREEVHVEQRNVGEQRAVAGNDVTLFQEGTIRVPVRGEEATITKETVITGEVAVSKDVTSEQRNVSDTVRKEHVEVDKNYQEGPSTVYKVDNTVDTASYSGGTNMGTDTSVRADTSRSASSMNTAADTGTYNSGAASSAETFNRTTTNTTTSTSGGTSTSGMSSSMTTVTAGMEVVGNDGDHVGYVKSVTDSNSFRVDRKGQGDITVTYGLVQTIENSRVVLTIPGSQVDLI
jgi:uncharacterized protein (TIGR02271 family)